VFSKSHIIYTDNTWSVALQCLINLSDNFTIVNVQIPCDSYENVYKYSENLGNLPALISDIDGKFVIAGDVNCDPRFTSPYSNLFVDFCTDEQLVLAENCLPDDSFTFISDAWHTSGLISALFLKVLDIWLIILYNSINKLFTCH